MFSSSSRERTCLHVSFTQIFSNYSEIPVIDVYSDALPDSLSLSLWVWLWLSSRSACGLWLGSTSISKSHVNVIRIRKVIRQRETTPNSNLKGKFSELTHPYNSIRVEVCQHLLPHPIMPVCDNVECVLLTWEFWTVIIIIARREPYPRRSSGRASVSKERGEPDTSDIPHRILGS